mgnify:CR=1 FL=1
MIHLRGVAPPKKPWAGFLPARSARYAVEKFLKTARRVSTRKKYARRGGDNRNETRWSWRTKPGGAMHCAPAPWSWRAPAKCPAEGSHEAPSPVWVRETASLTLAVPLRGGEGCCAGTPKKLCPVSSKVKCAQPHGDARRSLQVNCGKGN